MNSRATIEPDSAVPRGKTAKTADSGPLQAESNLPSD
jgi:hypothetical protein